MSYIKIWIHLVWSTKNRRPLLTKDIRHKVFQHIKQNAHFKGIYIDHINGYTDHVHCLISLKPGQNITKLVQLIKGESAFWVNKNGLTKYHFGWQEEYYAESISQSAVSEIRAYIRNQETHHDKLLVQEPPPQLIAEHFHDYQTQY